uniref:Dentinal fluid transport-stimulating peptide n=1 Tax=Rattus norvegicus TaxID=10116 RepID=DFTS_RAT|nr:RecName: Full=Dentinal fluid transport-stimulating peptide; Short=DFT-stimulating peptide [Rattus norvegicus]
GVIAWELQHNEPGRKDSTAG